MTFVKLGCQSYLQVDRLRKAQCFEISKIYSKNVYINVATHFKYRTAQTIGKVLRKINEGSATNI